MTYLIKRFIKRFWLSLYCCDKAYHGYHCKH